LLLGVNIKRHFTPFNGNRYGGIVTGPNGSTGQVWAPGNPRIGILSGGKKNVDSSRVRSDAAGLDVDFGSPTVSRLGGYYGDLGYINSDSEITEIYGGEDVSELTYRGELGYIS